MGNNKGYFLLFILAAFFTLDIIDTYKKENVIKSTPHTKKAQSKTITPKKHIKNKPKPKFQNNNKQFNTRKAQKPFRPNSISNIMPSKHDFSNNPNYVVVSGVYFKFQDHLLAIHKTRKRSGDIVEREHGNYLILKAKGSRSKGQKVIRSVRGNIFAIVTDKVILRDISDIDSLKEELDLTVHSRNHKIQTYLVSSDAYSVKELMIILKDKELTASYNLVETPPKSQ